MVEIMKDLLPKEVNKKIIYYLIKSNNWSIARDRQDDFTLCNYLYSDNKKDYGMSLRTFDEKENLMLDTPLNIYAEIIYNIISTKTKYSFKNPSRFFWNYYNSSSHSAIHKDEQGNSCVSFVYNLHSNNGGTEIDGKFYPAKDGEALVFPSNLDHRGIASTNSTSRFNLNTIVNI
tara:strand:- start:2082 stop:2606 length:525 start_codon:yes stop_codon:yes gene_type:complete